MTQFRSFLVAAFLLFAPAAGVAADGSNRPVSLPPPQATLVEANATAAWSSALPPAQAGLEQEADGFGIRLSKKAGNFWDAQALYTIDRPVRKGTTLYVTFAAEAPSARSEDGSGRVTVFFQQSDPPWAKPLERAVVLSKLKQTYALAFRADRDFEAGHAQLGFGFGEREQTVHVWAVRLVDYGPDVAPDRLPQIKQTYAGRDADAPWRAAAAARIDANRKADLTIRVIDAAGRPIQGATVSINQTKLDFYIGTAVTAELLTGQSDAARHYRDIVGRLFNHVVFENDLKWPAQAGLWLPLGDPKNVAAAIDWLKRRDIHIKGHNLIWPDFNNMPPAIGELRDDKQKLKAAIADHITQTAKRFAGKVDEWDVLNEPYTSHDVMDRLGDGVMADWFTLAHAADPNATLYLNDFGILASGDLLDTPHQDHFQKTIRLLQHRKAPLAALGLQGHFGAALTSPDNLLRILDRYAAFGLPMQITEYDLDSADPQLQADYLRDVMTIAFSHPKVNGFVMWGFWSKAHWRPAAAMYNDDFTPRPMQKQFERLVLHDWRTHIDNAPVAADGTYTTRAFRGTHTLSVHHAGHTQTVEIALPAGGKAVEVRF